MICQCCPSHLQEKKSALCDKMPSSLLSENKCWKVDFTCLFWSCEWFHPLVSWFPQRWWSCSPFLSWFPSTALTAWQHRKQILKPIRATPVLNAQFQDCFLTDFFFNPMVQTKTSPINDCSNQVKEMHVQSEHWIFWKNSW
jgi:hypothetical protein